MQINNVAAQEIKPFPVVLKDKTGKNLKPALQKHAGEKDRSLHWVLQKAVNEYYERNELHKLEIK